MRIMRVAVGAPMSNNHPNGKSTPEPFHTAAPQTLGVSLGLPRRSPSGRRRAHPSCQTGLTGLTGLTQAPRRRDTHTTVAITLPAYPCGKSAPAPRRRDTHTTAAIKLPCIPCGKSAPESRRRNTHTTVAIKQSTPPGKSSPEPHHTAAPQTHGVSHGLPRRSPSGRRRAHPSCLTGLTGLTGLTQAPRHRRQHTAGAIKLPCIPLR